MSTKSIRDALRKQFGTRRYRITRNGEIHVYSRMPNAAASAWWLFGWANDTTTLARLGVTA